MNKHSLERRLAVLAKARLLQVAPPPSPEEMLCVERVQELLERMHPTHANRVAEEVLNRSLPNAPTSPWRFSEPRWTT
jgi:hypothetical protein